MSTNFGSKIFVLRKIIGKVRNWPIILLVYLGLLKGEFFVLRLRNGINLKLRTNSTDIFAFINVWIVEEYARRGFEIQEKDFVVDIGGHIGLFTIHASQFCKKGKIITYEPIKENYELFLENLNLNNLKNITSYNLAVTGKSDKIRIYLSDSDQAAHTIHGNGKNFVEVNSVTLKEIIDSDSERIDLLKLDCEGAEYDILEALPIGYFDKISKICMEYHQVEKDFGSLNRLKELLVKVGFSVTDIPTGKSYGLLFANK